MQESSARFKCRLLIFKINMTMGNLIMQLLIFLSGRVLNMQYKDYNVELIRPCHRTDSLTPLPLYINFCLCLQVQGCPSMILYQLVLTMEAL